MPLSDTGKHLPVALVATAVVAISLLEGGYSSTVYAGASVLVWGAVVIGLALGLWPRADAVSPLAIAAGACLLALSVLAIVSTGWASDNGIAVADGVRWLAYAGLFALVIVSTRGDDARAWLTGLAIGFALVAVIAVSSRFFPDLPGGDAEIAEFLPGAAQRLSYPIGYWNGLGACMGLGIVLLAWLGAAGRGWLGRSLAIAAIPLPALAIYLASSRGGFAAALVGLAALVALGPNRVPLLGGIAIGGAGAGLMIAIASRDDEFVDAVGGSTEVALAAVVIVAAAGLARWLLDGWLEELEVPRPLALGAAGALAVVLLGGAIAANPLERLDEFNDPPDDEEIAQEDFVSSHLASSSGSGRYQFWSTAMDAFSEEPMKGVGAGGYGSYWNQNGTIQRSVRDAHSLFFESLAEIGVIGLVLVLGFVVMGPLGAASRLRADGHLPEIGAALAVLATGLTSAAIDWTWEVPAAFGAVVVAVALLTARRDGDEGDGLRGRGVVIVPIAVGAVAIVLSGALFLSQLKLESSQDAARDDDIEAAAEDAADARALQPWSAEPRLQQALVAELDGDVVTAKERLAEAIDRAPEDWRLWLLAVRLETNSGDVAKAEEALRRARELNPKAPIFPQQPSAQ